MPEPGSQIGAYVIVERIGVGGMGEVWLAEHAMLGRRAAIKVLRPELSMRTDIVARFFNEARAATAIADPGIVQVFDFGHHVDGSAYIVMELLVGEALDAKLRRHGPLAVEHALRVVRQAASSLGAAHARGIVHRDLKPENIFVVHDPEVPGGERAKLVDFGIAKLNHDHGGPKTKTAVMMGTPTYMSPEQCRGAGGVDQRADIYALGCVLFELLSGKPPFEAEGIGDVVAMHVRDPAPTLASRGIAVSPALEQLVARCLAKHPDQRFASGTALAAALGALLATPLDANVTLVDARAVAAASAAGAPRRKQPTTLSSAVGELPSTRMRRTVPALAGAAVIVVGIVVALLMRGGSRKESPELPVQPAASMQPAPHSPPAVGSEATTRGEPVRTEERTEAATHDDAAMRASDGARTANGVPTANATHTPDRARAASGARAVERPKPATAKQPARSPRPTPSEPPASIDLDGDGIPDTKPSKPAAKPVDLDGDGIPDTR